MRTAVAGPVCPRRSWPWRARAGLFSPAHLLVCVGVDGGAWHQELDLDVKRTAISVVVVSLSLIIFLMALSGDRARHPANRYRGRISHGQAISLPLAHPKFPRRHPQSNHLGFLVNEIYLIG